MKTLKNSLSVGILIFGTLVGAGFASGKEIWFYFARFGIIAYVMAFLTAVLFFFCSFLFFEFGIKFRQKNVQGINQILLKKMSFLGEIVFVLSNTLILSSMFAGADSLFFMLAPNISFRLGSVLTALISIFVVCFGFRGIMKTNIIVVPILLGVVFSIVILKIFGGDTNFSASPLSFGGFCGSLINSILFVCSNMFFSGFMFSKMGTTYNRKELLYGSLFGSFLLFISLCFVISLLFLCPECVMADMPLVFLATNINSFFGTIVLFVVWFGLLTTAFAILYTLSNWLNGFIKNFVVCSFIICFISLLLSGIGFSLFVQIVYPLLGTFGFIYIFLTIKALRKNKDIKFVKRF